MTQSVGLLPAVGHSVQVWYGFMLGQVHGMVISGVSWCPSWTDL